MDHNIRQYYVESWIDSIKPVTIPTSTIQLTLAELDLIKSIFEIIYSQYFSQLKKIQKQELEKIPLGKNNWLMLPCVSHLTSGETFTNLVQKCKKMIAPNQKSAKDSLCLKKYERIIQDSLKQKYPQNYQQESYRLALVVKDALSALEQLTTSQRIVDDINLHLQKNPQQLLKIHFRPWLQIPHSLEFRIFICKRQLTAISSYYKQELYPYLSQFKSSIQQDILQFFNKNLKQQLNIQSAVMDIGFVINSQQEILTELQVIKCLKNKEHKLVVIEVNPYGKMSGGALFSWQQKVLEQGPLQFRLSHEEHFA